VGEINFESSSVQSHLSILQGVINRMAANSAGCKTWCIALVSAIVVVIADKGRPELVLISALPVVLLFFLDAYYLALEGLFRDKYNSFVKKVHTREAKVEDVFIVVPGTGTKTILWETLKAFSSLSVWPFYSGLALMLTAIKWWVLPTP